MKTVGILLAGGQSRRFGSPKAFASLDGKFFYEWAYEALNAVCDHVVIISKEELIPLFKKELDVLVDFPTVAGQGPLAGIYTAMNERSADQYVVLPCDMPFIGANETERLCQLVDQAHDVTAIQTTDEHIPLFSIWNARVKNQLEQELINNQLSVMKFLSKLKTEWVESKRIHGDPAIFRNINRPD